MTARIALLLLALVTAPLAGVLDARAQAVPADAPVAEMASSRNSAISLELLGRGGLYSLNFDQQISPNVALGVGASYLSADIEFSVLDQDYLSISIFFVPLYANYYFSTGRHRTFATGGLDFVIVSGELSSGGSDSGVGAFGTAGAGYEFRGTGGFLFRAAPYLLFGAGGVAITGGLSFGAAF